MSKIFITGTSGIGKTTLGKHLSEKLKIPFINGSSKVLWEKYNLKSHEDLLRMVMNEPELGLKFQWELLDYRKAETKDIPNFITDRSPIDNAVYFLLQNSPFLSHEETQLYLYECRQYFKGDYKVIYLTHRTEQRVIEDDSMRIINPHYQNSVVGPIMDSYIRNNFGFNNHSHILEINSWNWYERILKIDDFLRDDLKKMASLNREAGTTSPNSY